MRRSQSPAEIASIGALGAAGISALVVYFASYSLGYSLVSFVAVFALSWGVFFYLLQQFIYKKIKIIYKNIYRSKTQGRNIREALQGINQDPIDKVSKEVLGWMKENQAEIDRLKEQAKFRREFLGNVSHELKTPIQSVQGYIHTLLDGALDDPNVNKKFLKKAGNGVDRLVELVDDLTSINTFENQDAYLHFEAFDIADLAEETFDVVRHLADEKKIRFGYKRMSSKSFKVSADRNKIRQVLMNLMVNAIKYGKEGGRLDIGFYDVDKNVLIEVTDTGDGIAEHHLPRLFERFYRTDKDRNRNEGGSGLGLSIVKHIVEAHGQTVTVRSTLGEGSTFGFTLEKA